MPHIIALDQGTTSSRAIVFDQDASIVAVGQREFRQIFPQPGWVEHDPGEIWATQISVTTEALGRAHLRPRDIAGIGITNQRETTVVWDRETGEPVYNAIVWQDTRTDELVRAYGDADQLRERVGAHPRPNGPHFSIFTLTRPHSCSFLTAQLPASLILGDPVSRGPYTSVK